MRLMVHMTAGLVAQDFPASLYMFSLSFPFFVAVHLCPLLFILLVHKAAPTMEGSCILVHQFKFLSSRVWLAQPTNGPWTTFSTLSSHLWSGPGGLQHRYEVLGSRRKQDVPQTTCNACGDSHQWPSVMDEESSGQLGLVTIQLPPSLKEMLMRSLGKKRGRCEVAEVAVRVAVTQSCPQEVLFLVVGVGDRKKSYKCTD